MLVLITKTNLGFYNKENVQFSRKQCWEIIVTSPNPVQVKSTTDDSPATVPAALIPILMKFVHGERTLAITGKEF